MEKSMLTSKILVTDTMRAETEADFMADNFEAAKKNKLMPQYRFDKRLSRKGENILVEHSKPPSNLYMELGYDRNREAPQEKHYRKWYNKPLEEVEDVFTGKPFTEEKIIRG
jgi:hypothetical protein